MIKRLLIIMCAALVIVGCSDKNTIPPYIAPTVITQTVKVPVPICDQKIIDLATKGIIKFESRPKLPILELTIEDESDYNKIGRSYLQTYTILNDYGSKSQNEIMVAIRDICWINNANLEAAKESELHK